MNRTSTRPSLLTRISDGKARATTTVDRSYREPRRQESFVERYRGTEFESPSREIVVHRSQMSRGRSFVLVGGVAALSLFGTIVVAAAA